MRQFIRLTLWNVPWFAGAILFFAGIGYLTGDLPRLSATRWLSLSVTGPLTVLALSAAAAAQAMWREKRQNSN
jgi:hypothetical protein